MNKSPTNIELRIDQLILHGFSPADRYPIADTVRGELERLFATEGVPPTLAQGGAIPTLDGGDFELTQNMSAQAIGVQVAQTVYGALKLPE